MLLDLEASSSSSSALVSSHTALDMNNLLSPTPIHQHLHYTSPHHPTHQAALQTIRRRSGSESDDDLPACTFPSDCSLSTPITCIGLPPHCIQPPYPPSPTWSFFSSSISIPTTTDTVTQPTPSRSGDTPSTTPGNHPPTTTMPVSSSDSAGLVAPDSRGLNVAELAAVIVGSVTGVFLLLLLLWLLRRGMFGSGTFFGFRYGDARMPGWGGTGQEMRQKGSQGYIIGASEPPSSTGSTLSVPFLADTKPPSYSHALSNSSPSPHKPPPRPPLSPPPWSTSSSAFDNAYAVSSISAHTRSRSHAYSASLSVSMSVSLSDNSTLVSEPAYARAHERNPDATASAPPPTTPIHAAVYRPVSIPALRRPPSPGETVSTSMVSFDRTDPDEEIASSETQSEWEVDTAESSQPLGRHFTGSGLGGAGG